MSLAPPAFTPFRRLAACAVLLAVTGSPAAAVPLPAPVAAVLEQTGVPDTLTLGGGGGSPPKNPQSCPQMGQRPTPPSQITHLACYGRPVIGGGEISGPVCLPLAQREHSPVGANPERRSLRGNRSPRNASNPIGRTGACRSRRRRPVCTGPGGRSRGRTAASDGVDQREQVTVRVRNLDAPPPAPKFLETAHEPHASNLQSLVLVDEVGHLHPEPGAARHAGRAGCPPGWFQYDHVPARQELRTTLPQTVRHRNEPEHLPVKAPGASQVRHCQAEGSHARAHSRRALQAPRAMRRASVPERCRRAPRTPPRAAQTWRAVDRRSDFTAAAPGRSRNRCA
jgi:hypothetical protein